MAYYISSKIPIKGFQKAFVKLREELYSDLELDYEATRQIEAYHRDIKNLSTKEEQKKEKEFIAGIILAFLLRKSKARFIGYYAILDAIVKTHVDNYKPVFIQQKIYENKWSEIQLGWKKETEDITTLLKMDQTLNHDWHANNIEYIKENSYKKLAKYVATAYIVNQTLQGIQKSLNTKKLQNQSIIQSIGGIVPDENIRLYDLIRSGKVPTAKRPIIISDGEGRWSYHQWQSYTRTDFPCYGVDGEVRKVGDKFSNGLYACPVHLSCYCQLKPVFRK